MKYLSCRSSDYSRNNWVFNKISIPSPNAPLLTKWLALYSTGKSCGGTRTKVVWRWHCARCMKVWAGTKHWVVVVVSFCICSYLSLSSFIFLSFFVACCELGGSRSNRCRKLHYLVLKTQQDLHLNNMSTTQNTREGCRSRPAGVRQQPTKIQPSWLGTRAM